MPYLSTHKTDAKYFTEQPCEHCQAVIKSTRGKAVTPPVMRMLMERVAETFQ